MMIPVIRYLSHIFPHETWPFASIFRGHCLLPLQRTNISHPWEKRLGGEDLLIPNWLNFGGRSHQLVSVDNFTSKNGPPLPFWAFISAQGQPIYFWAIDIGAISQKSAQGPILLQGAPPNPSTSINQSSHPEVAATSTKLQDANTVCVEHRRGRSRRRFREAWECDGVTGWCKPWHMCWEKVTEFCTPRKIDGWNREYTPGKEKSSSNQTIIFRFTNPWNELSRGNIFMGEVLRVQRSRRGLQKNPANLELSFFRMEEMVSSCAKQPTNCS